MQFLQSGKAPEEGGHHLDIIFVSKAHIQTQDLDMCNHDTWCSLYPSLEWIQLKIQHIQ
jgi:hypothetical protein